MLNLRIVAAVAAAQIFLVTVAWPSAPPLLGLALGALAGAVIWYLGRLLLRRLSSGAAADSGQALKLVALSALCAFGAVAAFYFVLRGPAGAAPWAAIAAAAAAAFGLVMASLRLNRLTAGG